MEKDWLEAKTPKKRKITLANEAWKLRKRARVLIVPTREAFLKFRRRKDLAEMVESVDFVITDRGEVVKSRFSKIYRPKVSK